MSQVRVLPAEPTKGRRGAGRHRPAPSSFPPRCLLFRLAAGFFSALRPASFPPCGRLLFRLAAGFFSTLRPAPRAATRIADPGGASPPLPPPVLKADGLRLRRLAHARAHMGADKRPEGK